MKLEISQRGSKEFYDEFLFIFSNYRKIIRNPHKKNHGIKLSVLSYGAFSIIFFIAFLIMYFVGNQVTQYLYVIGLFGFLIILSIICYIVVNARISKMMKKLGTAIFETNEQKINYSFDQVKLELSWDDIKAVIINKNSISYIPKKENQTFISIGINHKDEVIQDMNKYNKDDLIIDNTK